MCTGYFIHWILYLSALPRVFYSALLLNSLIFHTQVNENELSLEICITRKYKQIKYTQRITQNSICG